MITLLETEQHIVNPPSAITAVARRVKDVAGASCPVRLQRADCCLGTRRAWLRVRLKLLLLVQSDTIERAGWDDRFATDAIVG